MALPEYPNQISMGDIYEEREGNTPEGDAVTNLSLSNMAYLWGQPTDPDRLSEWHGLSGYYATYAGDLGGTIYFSNEGYQNHSITCANRQDGAATWDVNSTYSYGGTLTSVAIATVQDADGFVVNDDGQNRLVIQRSIPAFNAATIEVYMYPPSSGNTGVFSQVSFATSNGTVTSYSISTTALYFKMDTSASSLTSHSLTIYFDL